MKRSARKRVPRHLKCISRRPFLHLKNQPHVPVK
jgi:hypothetical protein